MIQSRSKTTTGPGRWNHLATVFQHKILFTIWPVLLGLVLLGAMLAGLLALPAAETNAAPAAQPPFPDQRDSLAAAVEWLITNHQNDNGGYTSFSSGANLDPSDAGGTVDAMLAIGWAGYPVDVPYPGKDRAPIDWMRTNVISVSEFAASGGGESGKVVLALASANYNARDFEGYNFVISLTNQLSTTGQFADTAFDHSLAMLALKTVNDPIPLTATHWLTSQQVSSGSWNGSTGATAMAIMALVAAGVPGSDPVLVKATGFLSDTQLADGGFEDTSGGGETAGSTALAVQALSALGEDFYSGSGQWAKNGNTPLSRLLELQNSDGAFSNSFAATTAAIPGVSGKPYPLASRSEAARRGVSCLATLQQEVGSNVPGSFPEFGDGAFGGGAGGTARALEALVVAGEDPTAAEWVKGDNNPVDALESLAPAYITDPNARGGRVGNVMQGVAAALVYTDAYTVTNFAGFNLVTSMTNFLDPANGTYASVAFGPAAHVEGMLGLLRTGYPVDPRATAFLVDYVQEYADGVYGPPNFSDPDYYDTPDSMGSALQGLGEQQLMMGGAVEYLRAIQEPSSTWTFFAYINSSAEVAQGLTAAGYNPFEPSWSKVVAGRVVNAAEVLAADQRADGCWEAFGGVDAYSLTDAVTWLSLRPGWAVEGLVLTTTVGLDPAVCATSDVITVEPDTEVAYCYQVENGSAITLPLHSVVDDQLGVVLGPDTPFELRPGDSFSFTRTAIISKGVSSLATWRAYDGLGHSASASDSAAVLFVRAYLPVVTKNN